MSATFNELMDAGVCKGACLLAVPKTACDCRCKGWFHGAVVDYLNRVPYGVFGAVAEFPGYEDIDIIKKGKRLRMVDHSYPSLTIWGRSA